MHRLLVLSLLLCGCDCGLVRVPKIYNALITSDENLSPSQAYPILEPVLRTTALGVAFPPIVVQNSREPARENVKQETTTPAIELQAEAGGKKTPPLPQRLTYHGSLYPLAFDPYVPYGYNHDFLYPALPFYQHPVFVDIGHYGGSSNNNRKVEKEQAPSPPQPPPPQPAINFKKNPDIPDVLPPLPITLRKS